jgi:thiosulfate reductase cytochrome b subunit
VSSSADRRSETTSRVYRHPLLVRVTHWVTALALIVLAMSGMQIFNAHPALYASDASQFNHPIFSIQAALSPTAQDVGYVQIGPWRINTTGVLGFGPDGMGGMSPRAFPAWATIPTYQDLADGRRWHIFFAWIFGLCALVYARWAIALLPTRADVRDLPRALREHLVPWRVAASAKLNPLQKFSYFGIVFIVAPIVIVSGMALSPAIDAHAHWLTQMFGGRQFARIWHFGAMLALMAFFVVHLIMVALTGLVNNLRSMITGWLVVERTQAR